MNVEAYLRAQIPGYPFEEEVLTFAACSPMLAEPVPMRSLNLNDNLSDVVKNNGLRRSLKYATSTLYYSVAGAFAGGSLSEQVGDVKSTKSGYEITQSDREHYRNMADEIRDELGCSKKSDTASDSGMFDASSLRKRYGRAVN
jgi:hypothetical protein